MNDYQEGAPGTGCASAREVASPPLVPLDGDATAAYTAAMRRRTPPSRPVVYAVVRAGLREKAAWRKIRTVLKHQLPGVAIADFASTFTGTEDYQARMPATLAQMAGLVVVPDREGWLGRAAAAEIRVAMNAQLPLLALAPAGLVALAECTIEAAPEPTPCRELRITPGRPGPATAATLAAIGVASP